MYGTVNDIILFCNVSGSKCYDRWVILQMNPSGQRIEIRKESLYEYQYKSLGKHTHEAERRRLRHVPIGY